eukprot:XP_019081472.1 PREDICTED: uncharacterized protein LOC109124154 [Vitis vinifera]
MPKTRGGLSASPSTPTPRPQQVTMGGAASPPVQAPAIPPSERGTPSQRRYPTRRPPTEPVPPTDQAQRPASRPPSKRTKFSGPGESSHAPQAEPPTEEPRIPVGITPETVIRRPMIAGPPIEGNLDCRDRFFHSETYFDIEADFREWSSFSQSDMVRILSRGTSTASVLTRRELPSRMLLIDVLLRANIFPLQHKILEHLGYPEEPRLERRCHCREDFSLDKWHHLTAYFAPPGAPAEPAPHGPPVMPPPPELPRDDQLPQAQQDEILTDTTPPAPAAHTSIQQHLSMQTPLGHDTSAPSEPLVPDEESLPTEQPIPEEEIRAEPSHDPTHI